jgi:hypothetical protein
MGKKQETDEYGVPIRKKADVVSVDEYGVPIKKKESTEVSTSSSPTSLPDSNAPVEPSQQNGTSNEYLAQLNKKNFVQRMNDTSKFIQNPDGTKSTHKMASANVDNKNIAFPTIVERNGKLEELDIDAAIDHAMKTGEFAEFATEKDAQQYAEGGYKKGTALENFDDKNGRKALEEKAATGDAVAKYALDELDRREKKQKDAAFFKENKGKIQVSKPSEIPFVERQQAKQYARDHGVNIPQYDVREGETELDAAGRYNDYVEAKNQSSNLANVERLASSDDLITNNLDFKTVAGTGDKEQVVAAQKNLDDKLHQSAIDYINSTNTDPERRAGEILKYTNIAGRRNDGKDLTDAEKKYLLETQQASVNQLANEQFAWAYELEQSGDVDEYVKGVQAINAKAKGLKDSGKLTEQAVKALEQEQAALVEKTNVSDGTLDEINKSFNNIKELAKVSNTVNQINNAAFAAKDEKRMIAEDQAQYAKDHPVLSLPQQFTKGVVAAMGKSVMSLGQLPEVLKAVSGDVTYGGANIISDSIQEAKDNPTFNPLPKDAPSYLRASYDLGSAVGSIATFAVGGSSRAATAGIAFLTSEADAFKEAYDMGMNKQEAGLYSSFISSLTSLSEGIIPDSKYFTETARASVINAFRQGKPMKEAIGDALKMLPKSAEKYIETSGKEGLEEGISYMTQVVGEQAANDMRGDEELPTGFTVKRGSQYQGFNAEDLKKNILLGAAAGGFMQVFNRPSPHSKVETEAMLDMVENREYIVSELEKTDPEKAAEVEETFVAAKENLDALKKHSQWANLTPQDQAHAFALTQQAAAIEEEQKAISSIRLEDKAKAEQIKAIEEELNTIFNAEKVEDKDAAATASAAVEETGADTEEVATAAAAEPDTEQTEKTEPAQAVAEVDNAVADIERRRQEELNNSKIKIPRYFTFKELGGAKGKSGKALSSIEGDRNEEIQQDFESKLQEGDKLIEPNGDIYYFKNGKVVKSNGQPRGMADIGAFINGVTIDRTDKINAKYNEELKKLKSTELTPAEAKKADIEIGKVGNTEYEVKVDGVYYQGKKLNNPENKTHRQLIEADIERRRQEELKDELDKKAKDIPVKKEYYKDTNGNDITVTTYRAGNKTFTFTKSNNVAADNFEDLDLESITPYKTENITSKLENKINAKYDAELKALGQQPTSTAQSESNPALRDVESTAKAIEKNPIFINNISGDEYYHGTSLPKSEPDFTTANKDKGVGVRSNAFMGTSREQKSPFFFITSERDVANDFSQAKKEYYNDELKPKENHTSRIIPFKFDEKNSKVLDLTKDNYEFVLQDIGESPIDFFGMGMYEQDQMWEMLDEPKFAEKLKSLGYDAVKFIEPKRGIGIAVLNTDKIVNSTPKGIAEAYHKAKADGSNPELVKAVEQSLKETPPALRDVESTAKALDAKKADIERRREEELDTPIQNFKKAKTKEDLIRAGQDWIGVNPYDSADSPMGVRSALLTQGGFEKGKELFIEFFKKADEIRTKQINAKYDAELAALENEQIQPQAAQAEKTEPAQAITETDNAVDNKPTFSNVPILTNTAEDVEFAKNEVFNNLSKLEVGSVIENSDGEIKVVTDKSTDKKGNQLIGVVTYERQEDGSLIQRTNQVWASKSADGKIKLDYNPHSTGTNLKGERVTVTDQITDKKIDLSKENIFTEDENGNLVQINKAPAVATTSQPRAADEKQKKNDKKGLSETAISNNNTGTPTIDGGVLEGEVVSEGDKTILNQEKDLRGNEKDEFMLPVTWSESRRVGDTVEFTRNGETSTGNFRGVNNQGMAIIDSPTSKDGKKYNLTAVVPVDDVTFPKYQDTGLDKGDQSAIEYAIENGLYEEAISNGRMTARDAAQIIESANLKVPESITKLSTQATASAPPTQSADKSKVAQTKATTEVAADAKLKTDEQLTKPVTESDGAKIAKEKVSAIGEKIKSKLKAKSADGVKKAGVGIDELVDAAVH